MASPVVYSVEKDSVEILRDRILQDYLRICLSKRYRGNAWVADYRKLLERQTAGGRGQGYVEPLQSLIRIGEDNFTVNDMDASIIQLIYMYEDNRNDLKLLNPSFNVRAYLKAIIDDRNAYKAHSSSNEQQVDLLASTLITLEHLSRFVINVYRGERQTMSESERTSYLLLWDAQIRELTHDVKEQFESQEHDRAIAKIIEDDIAWARTWKNPVWALNELYEEYTNRWLRNLRDHDAYLHFLREASNAGSRKASYALGTMYFEGDITTHVERDYALAGAYFMRVAQTPHHDAEGANAQLSLASILMNGLYEGGTREEGGRMLGRAKKEYADEYAIVPYEVDGMTFYRPEKKR